MSGVIAVVPKTEPYVEENDDPRDVSDTTALLGSNSPLVGAIFERCLNSSPLIDNHPIVRRTVLVIGLAASLGVNATFIPVSLHLPAGPAFAAANFLGFFKLDVWIIRGTIKDLWGPKSKREIVLLQHASRGKCYVASITVTAATLSLISQIPSALPAFDYNGLLAIPSVVCSLVGGTLIPLRSLQLSIDKTLRMTRCSQGEARTKLEKLRETIISLVGEHQEIFRKMGYSEKVAHVSKIRQLEGLESKKVNDYVLAIIDEPLKAPVVQGSSFSRKVSTIAGLWIAASLETALAIYTFTKTKAHVVDNDAIAGIFAGAVVGSGIYLAGRSIVNTTRRISETVLNLITCRREINVGEQLRPKLAVALKLLGLVVDTGALGATIVITGDFYKNDPVRRWYFETTLCAAYFLFLFTATLDIVDEVLEEAVLSHGTTPEKEIIEFCQGLRHLQQLVANSSKTDFSHFVAKLPAELRSRLLDKALLKAELLEQHLQRSTPV